MNQSSSYYWMRCILATDSLDKYFQQINHIYTVCIIYFRIKPKPWVLPTGKSVLVNLKWCSIFQSQSIPKIPILILKTDTSIKSPAFVSFMVQNIPSVWDQICRHQQNTAPSLPTSHVWEPNIETRFLLPLNSYTSWNTDK